MEILRYAGNMSEGSDVETDNSLIGKDALPHQPTVPQAQSRTTRRGFLKLLGGVFAAVGLGVVTKANLEGAKGDVQKAEENVQNYLQKRGEVPKNIPPTVEIIDQQMKMEPPPLWEREAGTPYPTRTPEVFSPGKAKEA